MRPESSIAGYVMTSTLRWEDHALTTFGLIPAVEKNVPGVKKNLYSLAGEGILCSRLFFIRAPGMVQVKSSQLISSQVASLASQLRTPVKASEN